MKTLVAALGAVALRLAVTNFAAPQAVGTQTVRMGCRPPGAGASMLAAGAAPALVSGKSAREGVAAYSEGRIQTPDGERSFEETLEAVKRNGLALQYASEKLQDYHRFLDEAERHGILNRPVLRHAFEELKRDRGVVMEVVKQKGYSLQHASEELKRYRAVVMEVVKQKGFAL